MSADSRRTTSPLIGRNAPQRMPHNPLEATLLISLDPARGPAMTPEHSDIAKNKLRAGLPSPPNELGPGESSPLLHSTQ